MDDAAEALEAILTCLDREIRGRPSEERGTGIAQPAVTGSRQPSISQVSLFSQHLPCGPYHLLFCPYHLLCGPYLTGCSVQRVFEFTILEYVKCDACMSVSPPVFVNFYIFYTYATALVQERRCEGTPVPILCGTHLLT